MGEDKYLRRNLTLLSLACCCAWIWGHLPSSAQLLLPFYFNSPPYQLCTRLSKVAVENQLTTSIKVSELPGSKETSLAFLPISFPERQESKGLELELCLSTHSHQSGALKDLVNITHLQKGKQLEMEAVPLVLEAPGTCSMEARSQKRVSTLSLRPAPCTPHFLVIVSPGWTHTFTHSFVH